MTNDCHFDICGLCRIECVICHTFYTHILLAFEGESVQADSPRGGCAEDDTGGASDGDDGGQDDCVHGDGDDDDDDDGYDALC